MWDDRVFVATAASRTGEDSLRIGLYGAGEPVDDSSIHDWQLLCFHSNDGRLLWERTAHSAVPNVKRHTKSSHANSTPATDGRFVVALFNFGGLYCYDVCGRLVWKQDLGVLDSGAFDLPEFQWGFGSSPVIFDGKVIVQCDIQKGSFIAAYDILNGREIWKENREELPAWGTPTVYEHNGQAIVATNGSNFARGLKLCDGSEVWRLSGNSFITVPTPVVSHDHVYLTSGYRPIQPVYAVRTSAKGSISLKDNEDSNEFVSWSHSRGGVYISTPIIVGTELYTLSTSGILACYNAKTGQRHYRARIGRGQAASFTASPVCADGHLYFTAEVGTVYRLKSGPEFTEPVEYQLGEYCLATPAISAGRMIFRTHRHLIAIGN